MVFGQILNQVKKPYLDSNVWRIRQALRNYEDIHYDICLSKHIGHLRTGPLMCFAIIFFTYQSLIGDLAWWLVFPFR
jgi:hypothetical protein